MKRVNQTGTKAINRFRIRLDLRAFFDPEARFPRTDGQKTRRDMKLPAPIEDSKVEWKSELVHVAKIIIPVQNVTSLAQDRFCENLSFSPWHSLPEHKPLGLVNRVRKIAYHRISKLRHELNHVPLQEPTGGEVFDPHAKNALDDSASE